MPLAYRPGADIGKEGPLPALSNGFITFGTVTRSIRINHHVIKVWSEILKKTKHSKLIVNSPNFRCKEIVKELKFEFTKHGIAEDRLDVYFESPPWDTMRKIDIALDCFPHNYGTTTLEHLYMGNPVVTLAGRPSVGRIGACYLKSIGRPEWIAYTTQDYIAKAVSLASDIKGLSKIRSTLREELRSSSFTNGDLITSSFENTYRKMWGIWCESEQKVSNTVAKN